MLFEIIILKCNMYSLKIKYCTRISVQHNGFQLSLLFIIANREYNFIKNAK